MRKLTIEMANRQHLEEVQQEALGMNHTESGRSFDTKSDAHFRF